MNITGGESLSLFEAQEAADIVQDAADEDGVEVLEVALVPKPVLEALRPCEVGLSSKPVAITVTIKLQVLVSEQVQLQALQHKQVRQEKNHSLKAHQACSSGLITVPKIIFTSSSAASCTMSAAS
jgi:hypothetical protein